LPPHTLPLPETPVPHDAPFGTTVSEVVLVAGWQIKHASVGPDWFARYCIPPTVQEFAPQLPFRQVFVPPQLEPSLTGAPVSVQVELPVAHDVNPVLQGSAGVQLSPATQGAHVPLSQTESAPQLVPFERAEPVSAHTAIPEAHDVAPV
jgi:hypothetical protein